MKIASAIVLFWFSMLTIQPAVAEVCRFVQSQESCCKKDCSAKDESKVPCKDDDSDCCGGGVCTPCSVCACCFTAVIEKENFSFVRNSEDHYLNVVQKQNARSGFLTSPFQPPEFI